MRFSTQAAFAALLVITSATADVVPRQNAGISSLNIPITTEVIPNNPASIAASVNLGGGSVTIPSISVPSISRLSLSSISIDNPATRLSLSFTTNPALATCTDLTINDATTICNGQIVTATVSSGSAPTGSASAGTSGDSGNGAAPKRMEMAVVGVVVAGIAALAFGL